MGPHRAAEPGILEHPVTFPGLGSLPGDNQGAERDTLRCPPVLTLRTEGPGAWLLCAPRAGRRGLGFYGARQGGGSPAHHQTHRLAAALQHQDLGSQLGDLPPPLVLGLRPERQHLRQVSHPRTDLGTSLALRRPLSTPPLSSGRGLGARRTPHFSLGLHPNECLLTDMEQGPG